MSLLMEALLDWIDIADARAALKEYEKTGEAKSLDEIKKELGVT